MSQIKIRDAQGTAIPFVNVRIAEGMKSSDEAIFDVFTDLEGNTGWPVPYFPSRDYTLFVNDRNVLEDFDGTSVYTTDGNDIEITLVRKKTGWAFSRLHAERFGFVNESGVRVPIAGVSAFMHYEKMLRGENINDRLDQVQQLGSNCVRVFGMAHYVPVNAGRPAFKPQDWPQYFDAQAGFFARCATYGQYVYWSVFPDVEKIGVSDKRGFLDREVAALKVWANTFGELTNEQDAHSFNAVDPRSVNRPQGIAFCSGSYGDIGGAQPEPWDFCDYHTPRGNWTKHIKDSCVVDHPNYIAGKGIVLGEPDRFGSGGNGDLDLCRLSAGASCETAMAHIFHSAQGRESVLYDEHTANIAKAFFRALGR